MKLLIMQSPQVSPFLMSLGLSTLFSDTLSLRSSFNVKGQFLHPNNKKRYISVDFILRISGW